MFAQNAYAHTKVPTFVENSALDMWQTWCIYCASYIDGWPHPVTRVNGNCSSVPGWRNCSKDPEACTAGQIAKMNQYMDDFVAVLEDAPTFHAPGNGAFIHSCHTHCDGIAGGWGNFKIDGVAMGEAAWAWWTSDGTDAASKHTYTPCRYRSTSPHRCNPSCPSGPGSSFHELPHFMQQQLGRSE